MARLITMKKRKLLPPTPLVRRIECCSTRTFNRDVADTVIRNHYRWLASFLPLVAANLGIFTAIHKRGAKGISTKQALKLAGLERHPCSILLMNLIANCFLELDGDRIRVSPAGEAYLPRNCAAAQGTLFDYLILQAGPPLGDIISRIQESLIANSSAPYLGTKLPLYKSEPKQHTLLDDQPSAVAHACGMASRAAVVAPHAIREIEKLIKLDAANSDLANYTIVDVGCGPFVYGAAFAKRFQRIKVIGFDLPAMLSVGTEVVKCEGISDRVQLIPLDLFNARDNEIPKGKVAWVSSFLHDWRPDKARFLFRQIAKVAPTIFINASCPISELRAVNAAQANYSAFLFLITGGGLHSAPAYTDWAKKEGFIPFGEGAAKTALGYEVLRFREAA
jgi:hypothetical protein